VAFMKVLRGESIAVLESAFDLGSYTHIYTHVAQDPNTYRSLCNIQGALGRMALCAGNS